MGGRDPSGHRRGQDPEAPAGRALGKRLRVGRVGAAARIARAARLEAPAPELVVVGPRRRLLDLGRLMDRPPDEVEQAGDGDLQDHREEEDRPEPLHCFRQCSPPAPSRAARLTWASVRPRSGLGGHQQRGGGALDCPRLAGLVDAVVYPGERAVACVAVDGLDLPVGGAEARAAVEGQEGELSGKPEDLRQPVVGPILPAGRPDDLVVVREAAEPLADAVGNAVRHAVDQMEAPGRLGQRPLEAEQADHAVDIQGEDRAADRPCPQRRGETRRTTDDAARTRSRGAVAILLRRADDESADQKGPHATPEEDRDARA